MFFNSMRSFLTFLRWKTSRMLFGVNVEHKRGLRRYSNECDSGTWRTVTRMSCQVVNSKGLLSQGRWQWNREYC